MLPKKDLFRHVEMHIGKVHPAVQVIVCFIAAICGATVITEFLRKFKVTKVMFEI